MDTKHAMQMDDLKSKFRLLVVDDNENNRFTLTRRLKREGYTQIQEAIDGNDALQKMAREPFDLVLLDIMMPEMDGYQVLEIMKSHQEMRQIPVIVVSALSEIDSVARCIELGAEDYLPKPFDPVLLRARIGASLEKKRLREIEASFIKYHDVKTGLPNREKFALYLRDVLRNSTRLWVLRISLDRFQSLTDSFGVAFGEAVLEIQIQRVQSIMHCGDYLARSGDNELLLLMNSWGTGVQAQSGIEALRQKLLGLILVEGREIVSPVSIGAYQTTGVEANADEIVCKAGQANGIARREGGNRFQIYDPESHERAVKRLELENDLRLAREHQELQLYYQPIIRSSDGSFAGVESLLRWHHVQHGMIPPGIFIPLAEENSEIVPIGQWVLREAIRQAVLWRQMGVFGEEIFVTINVSGRQFEPGNLVHLITAALAEFQLPTRNIKLEITESAILSNPSLAKNILDQLSQMGIYLAIDDFGTGYSSFSYLHRFSFSTLKIDRAFITGIHRNTKNYKIVRAINGLAMDLDMEAVAEGVETAEEMEVLRDLGIPYLQGYYLSRPLPAQDVPVFLSSRCKRALA